MADKNIARGLSIKIHLAQGFFDERAEQDFLWSLPPGPLQMPSIK